MLLGFRNGGFLALVGRQELLRGAVGRVNAVEPYLDKVLMRLRLVCNRQKLDVRVLPVVGRFLHPVAVVEEGVSIPHYV